MIAADRKVMSACPTDRSEAAEAYVMHRLAEEEAAAFEEHCLTCPDCTAEVIAAEKFVRAMRAAAMKFQARAD